MFRSIIYLRKSLQNLTNQRTLNLAFLINLCLYLIGYIGAKPGNTKGGSITVLLTSCLTGLDSAL
jgi:hypothetical protein